MKKGVDQTIPEEIAIGLDTTKPNLLERRCHWNKRTPEAFALPTEIWRETIERLQRYNNIKEKIVILTATSGDTGKAAMEGFSDVEGTEIIVFYPKDGVSDFQERQMKVQKGKNTHTNEK